VERKNLLRRIRLVDLVVIMLIIITPILFFIYNLIPQNIKVIETYYFALEAGYYETINAIVWQLSLKFLSSTIFILWFLTCKHWWRYFLLISIAFELYKLYSVLNEIFSTEPLQLANASKFILIIMMLLLLISYKMNYFSFKKSFSQELNFEIDNLLIDLSKFKSKNYKKFKSKFVNIKDAKLNYSEREYLKLLIELREEFALQVT
jgi:hypothetical protein